ncbi:hypothetical protein SSX86_030013 [Deinandra increscens subsp. villosa]|uniref:Uncharacterized protein n=1 Tax=Deinandra increscens subsp. villosa TaxID=3103831 RepID=A0AAP0CBL8_9ASTR
MEKQVITPSPAATPYTTAPSTPLFYSAPTSPIHALVGFQQDHDHDFAFNFTQPPPISAADDLFHAGKIKPLKPISDESPKSKDLDSFTWALNRKPGEQTQSPPKRSRSSPFRISDILSDEDNNRKNSLTWYSKWNLKNLILFRSASEGSTRRSKDPVNKYTRITKGDEGVKISRCRSGDSCSSSSVVGRVTRKVSAHEIHYTANRAVAEEMRRKTYLPYKSGLFGCLGFHNNGAAAANVHQISRGVNSVLKQR